MEVAYWLVPWLEGLPGIAGKRGRIRIEGERDRGKLIVLFRRIHRNAKGLFLFLIESLKIAVKMWALWELPWLGVDVCVIL